MKIKSRAGYRAGPLVYPFRKIFSCKTDASIYKGTASLKTISNRYLFIFLLPKIQMYTFY